MMNINNIDFNDLYKSQKQATTFKPKNSDDWDKKASGMAQRVFKSIYNEQFLQKMRVKSGSSILDVGCGAGNLCKAFAPRFDKVYGIDYSEGMLEQLRHKCQGVDNIEVQKVAWEDDWSDLPKCDVVVASRSMEVADMKAALQKLDKQAKKAVYLTYKVGGSFLPKVIMDVLDLQIVEKPDYIYIVNILYGMGIDPEITYIESENSNFRFNGFEEFVKRVGWSLGEEVNASQRQNLYGLYEQLQRGEKAIPEHTRWAMISWHKG